MRFQSPAAVALATPAIAPVATGCGFDEKLTTRGFVETGDGLCGEAIGRSFIAVQSAGGAAALDSEGVETVAASYAGIAQGLRSLDLRDEDEAMRDEMVSRYAETATQIRDAAAGPAAPVEMVVAIEELRPFAAELRDYGFKVCGGREPV